MKHFNLVHIKEENMDAYIQRMLAIKAVILAEIYN